MARRKKIVYKDVFTGKVYEYLPKRKILVSSLTDKLKRATFGNNPPLELKLVTYNPETAEIVADEVELPEVEVVAPRINPLVLLNPRDTDLNLRHRIEVANADELVKENTAFDRLLNFLSPTNYIGATFDYYLGESPFWKGVYKGTSGIVPDNFAANNPRAATLINMLGDMTIPYGLRTGYKGLNTYKVIGLGGESVVLLKRNPFTTHVIKHSTIPPEEMAVRNRVPRMVKSLYLGLTPEGLYIYKLPRMFFPKNPTAAMSTIAQDLAHNLWFPSEYPNLQGTAFFNIKDGLVLNDLGETGYGLIGRTWYGRRGIGDGYVLPIQDFVLEMEKHGGKLIPRKYNDGGNIKTEESFKLEMLEKNNPLKTLSDMYEAFENENAMVVSSDISSIISDMVEQNSGVFIDPKIANTIKVIGRIPGAIETVGAVANMLYKKEITPDHIRDLTNSIPGGYGMLMSALNLIIDLNIASTKSLNHAKATSLWTLTLDKYQNKGYNIEFKKDGSWAAYEYTADPTKIGIVAHKHPKAPETEEEVNEYLTKYK